MPQVLLSYKKNEEEAQGAKESIFSVAIAVFFADDNTHKLCLCKRHSVVLFELEVVAVGLNVRKRLKQNLSVGFLQTWGQCYKTFYVCNVRFFVKLECSSLAGLSSVFQRL